MSKVNRNYKVSGKKLLTSERNMDYKCWKEGVKKGLLPPASACPPDESCARHNSRQLKKTFAKRGKRLGRVEAALWAQEMASAECDAYGGYY